MVSLTTLPDAELEKLIQEAWHKAVDYNIEAAQTSLLIAELGRRENRKVTRLSLCISALALVVALISAVFSFIDWRGDRSWQEAQIELLRNIGDALKK